MIESSSEFSSFVSELRNIELESMAQDFPKLTVFSPNESIGGYVDFDPPASAERNGQFVLAKTKGLVVRFQHGLPVIDAGLTNGNEYLLIYHQGSESRTYYGNAPKYEISGLTLLVSKAVEVKNFKEGYLTEFFGYTALFKVIDPDDWSCNWAIQCPYTSVVKEFSISKNSEGALETPKRTIY